MMSRMLTLCKEQREMNNELLKQEAVKLRPVVHGYD